MTNLTPLTCDELASNLQDKPWEGPWVRLSLRCLGFHKIMTNLTPLTCDELALTCKINLQIHSKINQFWNKILTTRRKYWLSNCHYNIFIKAHTNYFLSWSSLFLGLLSVLWYLCLVVRHKLDLTYLLTYEAATSSVRFFTESYSLSPWFGQSSGTLGFTHLTQRNHNKPFSHLPF